MRFQFQAGAPAPMKRHEPVIMPAARPARTSARGLRRGATVALLAAAAAGCSHVQPPMWKIQPVLEVKHSVQSSEAYYALGRYHDGSQAWDKAIGAYRNAIAADPRNAEAHNALGVALARLRRHEQAEAALRQAVAIAPGSAHIHNNLGLLLLMSGRPQEAIGELTAAVNHDPGNIGAQVNLREARASSERGTGSKADTAVAVAEATAVTQTELAEATEVALPVTGGTADAEAAPVAPVQQVEPATQTVVAEVIVPPNLPVTPFQLELSNGNGITGAAARLKRWLNDDGLAVERLTNHRPYVQQQTVIQYRAGQQDQAQRVARALQMTAQLDATPVAGLRPDVRVILGLDWVRTAACLEQRVCKPLVTVAAAMAR